MTKLMIKTSDNKWTPMAESEFTQEKELQDMLLENPELIPVDDLGDNIPPMLVVGREFNIPGIGFIDLLCVDESGLVTIVECKLDKNSEIKRKVVGQILSYAAHLKGYSYSQFEEITNDFFGRRAPAAYRGKNLLEAMDIFCGEQRTASESEQDSTGNEAFRQNLEECLQLGKFRLLIIVDKVNDELRNIVEYLDKSTGSAFAIHCCEIGYFKSAEAEVIVPRMIGFGTKKLTPPTRRWDIAKFEAECPERLDKNETETLMGLVTWAAGEFDRLNGGTGALGSLTPQVIVSERPVSLFWAFVNGKVTLLFSSWKQAGLSDENTREAWQRFTQIDGLAPPPESIDTSHPFYIKDINSTTGVEELKSVLSWVAEQLQSIR